jgi:hypothetical protein
MRQTRTSPTSRRDALGPLVVSEKNPRYFSVAGDAGGPAVYLAGSHIWHNLQDGIGPGKLQRRPRADGLRRFRRWDSCGFPGPS